MENPGEGLSRVSGLTGSLLDLKPCFAIYLSMKQLGDNLAP